MLGEEENYKNLGILEVDTIKPAKIKEKVRKESLGQTRELLETKLSSWNLWKR